MLFISIFIKLEFPLKKLIFVGVFSFLGYSLLTGISHVFKFNLDAFTDKKANNLNFC